MVKIAFDSRAHAKLTTKTARVQGGPRSDLPRTQAVLVVDFAWARELNVNSSTMTAWLQGFPPLLPLKSKKNNTFRVSLHSEAPRRPPKPETRPPRSDATSGEKLQNETSKKCVPTPEECVAYVCISKDLLAVLKVTVVPL